MSDRTVHARTASGEIVRYDRAGKWYFEPPDGTPRHQIGVRRAARYAVSGIGFGGTVFLGLEGGAAFDRWYYRLLEAWQTA